ncbi:hypothetical protein ABEB36_012562 [Hypothenemus hampei]|uniref:Uncharacterized protein n=1 Tax=Hypothenemus hampei TaxID=57062 RepID=A0ABD1EBW9_HYPHA
MEDDFYGFKKQIWILIRNQREEANQFVTTNSIRKQTWVQNLKELHKKEDSSLETVIEEKDVEELLMKLKNRKNPSLDDIPHELFKYDGRSLDQLTTLPHQILLHQRILD